MVAGRPDPALDRRRIGLGDGEYETRPRETMVWLMIFEGRWELTPLGSPSATNRPAIYEGCLFTVFAARDGGFISLGDSTCPPPP